MDIDLLAKMIRDVVLEKDEVALPGLGVFVAEFVPASFSDKGFTINPPYKRLTFRQEVNAGDDTLIRMYAEANNIGEDAAARIVNDFLSGLKDILMVRKAVVFPELGKLRATRENNFFFIADENLDIYPEGFGLEPVSLKTHQEAVSEVAETMAGLRSILEPDNASGTDIAPESETPPAPETAPESESVPASETVLEADSAPESENAAEPEVEPVVVAAAASGIALQTESEDEPMEVAEEGVSGDDAEGESVVETGSEAAEEAVEDAAGESAEEAAEQAADGCAEGDAEQSGTNAEDTMEIAEETVEEFAEESAAETESEPAEETAAAEEESAEEPVEEPAAEAAAATSGPEKDNDFGIIPPLDIQIEETDPDAEAAPLADADLALHPGQDSEPVSQEFLSEILVIEDNGKAIEDNAGEIEDNGEAIGESSSAIGDNANEPSRSSRFWKTFRIIAVTLAVLAILALAAFIILSRVAPDFIDRILYSPEELDIVRQMTSVR
ncbi:MAG: hypothetical protein SPI33_07455 [Candidatus Cryptobacteroides sp.]|nr:hypothetical protein [Candidatus Cryptobacteroides sp.]